MDRACQRLMSERRSSAAPETIDDSSSLIRGLDSERGSRLRKLLQVRFQIIRSARIENVGKSQSCMVSSYADVVVVNVTGILTARLSTDAASANRILSTSADWPYVF